ncbi:MAG: hypothetical protein JWQ27_2103 [Ferruginibacter sp.]|nr:hypothetical protein [Ferruginibacter sp.]
MSKNPIDRHRKITTKIRAVQCYLLPLWGIVGDVIKD